MSAADTAATTAEQARDLVGPPEAPPTTAAWLWWVTGFCAGWDAACLAEVQRRVQEIAETIAAHETTAWVEAGQFSRERRIAREVAEGAAYARTVQQTHDWPHVAEPGEGGGQ